MSKRVIAAALAAAAFAVPTAAAADPGHGGSHDKQAAKVGKKREGKQAKNVTFVFRGTFTAPGTVEVVSGNAHVRKGGFVGQAVTVDFAAARIVVADTNGDAQHDLADVKDGDLVLVQARAVKGTRFAAPTDDGTAEPIVARRLIDKTNAPVEDASGD